MKWGDPYNSLQDYVDLGTKSFKYEELFKISKPLPDNEKEKLLLKWNRFNVSTYDDIKQIFYDIAFSKNARNLYRKANFISISLCFLKFLIIILQVLSVFIVLYSRFKFFFISFEEWSFISSLLLFAPFLFLFISSFFLRQYTPSYDVLGTPNLSYRMNKDGPIEMHGYFFFGHFFYWNRFRKIKNNSSFYTFKAHNGNEYLLDKHSFNKYYLFRNWYLTAKYITMNKVDISQLPKYFEDSLFVFIKPINDNETHKKDNIKLRQIFNVKFSLNFMSDFWINSAVFSVILMFISAFTLVFTNLF